MGNISDFAKRMEPFHEPSLADLIDKDKHGRLIIGTKKWLAFVIKKAFDKYKDKHPGLIPNVQADYPLVQKEYPAVVIYNLSALAPHSTSKMIGYNIVQDEVIIEGKDQPFTVRLAQYSMTVGVDIWCRSTFERDAALDIITNELWIVRRIELGSVGITVQDVNGSGERVEDYGTDKIYGVGVSIPLLVEIQYFLSADGEEIIWDIRQDWAEPFTDKHPPPAC